MLGNEATPRRLPVKQVLYFDEALLISVRRLQVPRLTTAMRMFTRLGDASTTIPRRTAPWGDMRSDCGVAPGAAGASRAS